MESRPTQRLAFRSRLEDDIDNHFTQIYALRRRINTLAPIFGLPEDILVMVFKQHLLSSFEAESVKQNHAPVEMLGWLLVTHVCHVWRETAIHCPNLWTYVVLPKSLKAVGYLQAVLARSASLPIHFRAWGPVSDPRMALFEIALKHLPRMVSVEFDSSYYHNTITPATEDMLMDLFFNNDAPLLSQFHANHTYYDYEPGPFELSTSRHALRLPSLKVLSLLGQPFHVMRRFIQPTLTSLTIGWSDEDHAPFAMVLLDVLSQLPSLELLGVVPLSPSAHVDLPHANHPSSVELSRLRSFTLSSSYGDSGPLLESLTLPNTVAFDIRMPEEMGETTSDTDILLSAFRQKLAQSVSRRPLLAAIVQFHVHNTRRFEDAEILAWEDVGPEGGIPTTTQPIIRIDMSDLRYSNHFKLLPRFYDTLPLSNLVSLVIRDAIRRCPSAYWRRLFNSIPALENLEVSGSARTLVCCLTAMEACSERPDSELTGDDEKTLVVPLLSTLTIGPNGGRPASGGTRRLFRDTLQSVLELRRRDAPGIRKLKILWGPKGDSDQLRQQYEDWVDDLQCVFDSDWDTNVPRDAPSEGSASDSELPDE